MLMDTPSNGSTEIDGNGISNEPSENGETRFTVFRYESIVAREALQNRGLPQRDGAILLRVTKSAIAKPITLSRHRRCGLVPCHSSIDTGISTSTVSAMTIGNQIFRPVSPGTTGF